MMHKKALNFLSDLSKKHDLKRHFLFRHHPERGVQLARAVADHDHDVEQLCRGERRRVQAKPLPDVVQRCSRLLDKFDKTILFSLFVQRFSTLDTRRTLIPAF